MTNGLVFAVGASAGGVEALRQLVSEIPGDFAGSILIVQHTPENGLGTLADLLARRANIPVVLGSDRLVIRPGVAYVAPPGRHMLVNDGRIQLQLGPSVNRHRPAIDPTFRSVAENYGSRAVGVIMTGYLDDGVAGLIAIREVGGKTIIQDPADATVPSMPEAALQYVTPDFCVPLTQIATTMVSLTATKVTAINEAVPAAPAQPIEQPTVRGRPMADEQIANNRQSNEDSAPYDARTARGNGAKPEPLESKVSPFVCPECLGTLWESTNHNLLQFTCRVGHSFSAETMYTEQAENMERAIWSAIRVLQEHADLSLRLAERARKSGHELASIRFENRFKDATRDHNMLRELLMKSGLIDEQDAHTAD